MSENTESKKKIGKKGIIIIIIAALLMIAGLIAFFLFRGKIRATTMRLLRLEGTVSMEENGREKTIKENLRLKSGNALNTEVKSLASIGLDDAKVVTMNETSRAEFTQKGKYLDLNLTRGSLFFEVDKPLEEDETFEIRTSTMVVGIRGTSGYVSVEGGIEELILTDGHVHVVGTNPVTGEVKEADVSAGQRLRVYLYNDRKVDSIMFELEDITERELPEFVLRILREDSALLDRVIKATGWDKPWILGLSDEGSDETDDANTRSYTEENTADPAEGNDTTDDNKPEEENDAAETDEADTNTDPAENDNGQNAVKPAKNELQKQIDNAKAEISQTNQDGTITLKDGTIFDPSFYAVEYPDIAAAYGTSPEALLAHYIAYGKKEGRKPNGFSGYTDTSSEDDHNDSDSDHNDSHDQDDGSDKDSENGADNGDTNGGSTDNGDANGGSTDNGDANGGSTDNGNTNGGSTDNGNTNGGSTDNGNTSGGSTSGGSTSGGSTSGGTTGGSTSTTTTNANETQAGGAITLSDGSQGTYGNGTLTITAPASGTTTVTIPASIKDESGNTVNLGLGSVSIDPSSGITSVNASALASNNTSDMIRFVGSYSDMSVTNSTTTITKTSGAGAGPTVNATVQTGAQAGIDAIDEILSNNMLGSTLGSAQFGNYTFSGISSSGPGYINDGTNNYADIVYVGKSGDTVVLQNMAGTKYTFGMDGTMTIS